MHAFVYCWREFLRCFFSGACADELPLTLKPQVNPRAVYDWKNAMKQ